jgi:death-on-curing protein
MSQDVDRPHPGRFFLGVTWWPKVQDLADLHTAVLEWYGYEHSNEVLARLDAVLLRPINQAMYGGFRGDIFDAAATMTASVAVAHAFPDGNKRTAAAIAVALLRHNGHQAMFDQIDLADHVLRIVETSQVEDDAALDVVVSEFAAFLRAG